MTVFPFFIGCGRSGTTLVRAMFDSHPDLAVFNESYFLLRMLPHRARYERDGSLDESLFLTDLSEHLSLLQDGMTEDEVAASFTADPPESFTHAIRRVFALYADVKGKRRYGSKTPEHVWQIPVLAKLFPEARFVHVVRDGRDVALSLIASDWGPNTVADAAIFWDKRVRRGIKTGRPLGDRYCEIRYERLVADTEGVLRELCPLIGLEFDEKMLRYFERGDDVIPRTPSWPRQHEGLRMPPRAGLRDWRRDMADEDVALFEQLAGRSLRTLGYETTFAGFPRQVRARARRRAARVRLVETANRARRAPARIRALAAGRARALAA